MKTILNDTHFEILGISKSSTKEEIKKAYKTQIKKWHPDKFPNDVKTKLIATEKAKKIIEAYDLLKSYEPHIKGKIQSKSTVNDSDRKSHGTLLNIDLIKVKSSNIDYIGFDVKTETLQIQFNNGNVYQYYNVPKPLFDDLINSSSKGKFAHRFIYFSFKYESF